MNRNEAHRPQFHFSPGKNWINDPNGLIWFEGEYHLFFQTNPFGDQWGHMSWGHAVSTDLVNWQELPVAIAEDERASIYSGSVVVDWRNSSGFGDGTAPPLVAIYTGCLRVPEGGQAQELAYSTDRGRSWVKYADNPVLDLGLRDFRDPKVFWHEATARWVMVVVLPDDRKACFYASADLKCWQWLSDFSSPFPGEGIWECPDLIPLPDGEGQTVWMFKVDVLAGHPSGGSGARIFFGTFDGTRFVAQPEDAPRWADWGADFYAALSWSGLPDAPQRQVWLAWMNCHRYAKHLPSQPWRGAMSVPRQLSVRRSGTRWDLLQQPVPALHALRDRPFRWPATALESDERTLLPSNTRHRQLELTLQVLDCKAQHCGLQLRSELGEVLRMGYHPQQRGVFVDRSRSGFCPPDDAHYPQLRWAPVVPPSPDQPLRLRVLVDWSSVEVFIGDGEQVVTEQFYARGQAWSLSLYADQGLAQFGALEGWTLHSARMTGVM